MELQVKSALQGELAEFIAWEKNQTPHNKVAKRRAASPGRAEGVVGSAFSDLQENQRVLAGREEQQQWNWKRRPEMGSEVELI